MGFLFVTWIFLRNLLYAALQTNVIWTVAHFAVEPLEMDAGLVVPKSGAFCDQLPPHLTRE